MTIFFWLTSCLWWWGRPHLSPSYTPPNVSPDWYGLYKPPLGLTLNTPSLLPSTAGSTWGRQLKARWGNLFWVQRSLTDLSRIQGPGCLAGEPGWVGVGGQLESPLGSQLPSLVYCSVRSKRKQPSQLKLRARNFPGKVLFSRVFPRSDHEHGKTKLYAVRSVPLANKERVGRKEKVFFFLAGQSNFSRISGHQTEDCWGEGEKTHGGQQSPAGRQIIDNRLPCK